MSPNAFSLEQLSEKIHDMANENGDLKGRLTFIELEMNLLIKEQQVMADENLRIQEELVLAKEKAEEGNLLKSNLLSNLSHEFRTPMNGILGFAEILKEHLSEKDLVGMANNILRSGKRLLSTFNSILFLSELESEKVKNSPAPLHVNTFILSNLGEFESRAYEKKIYIKTHFQDWKLRTQCDSNLLRIAVHQLIDNAIKFTETGGITLETGRRVEREEEFVYISVMDTGIGIEPCDLEKIFEPFRQVSEGWGRFYEGNGLGLSICQRIVIELNGTLQVDSTPGQGSGFTILLPLIPVDEEVSTDSAWASIHASMEKHHTKKQGELPAVLIVEDNSVNKELMLVFLKRTCHAEYAQDGETAIQKAGEKKYAAILMDINLGAGMDGLEATRRIRELPDYQDVPIIAVTGYTLSGDKERLLEGGCSHYLAKPFDRSTIVNLVEDVLYTGYSN